jgi:hypothetical protein
VFPEPPFDGLSVIVHPGAVVSGFVPLHGPITISLPEGSFQTVTNNGIIGTSAVGASSIGMSGGNEVVTNNGSIVTSGLGAQSIGIAGVSARVANNGSITTTGDLAEGVAIEGNNAEVTNGFGGEILVSGERSEGIGIEGNSADVINASRITVDGSESVGLEYLGTPGLSPTSAPLKPRRAFHQPLVSRESVAGSTGTSSTKGLSILAGTTHPA